MPDFRHLAPRFRASKTRNGLIFVALPLGNNPAHWTRCRLVRLHEAPNRASGQDHAPQTELSCTPIPPTQFVGYILSYPSYIISKSDGPAMTAASMESCRFAARRSPRGRFWSVVDVRKRLQRVRHPSINLYIISSKVLSQPTSLSPKLSRFDQSSSSTGACGVGDHPTPDLSQRASERRSASEKSK